MAAATTRDVVGFVTNLSAEQIEGAFLRFNPDAPVIAVDDTVVVGMASGTVPGERVVPLDPDGAFTMPMVAVDNPTWTVTVTVDGPNIELPLPSFVIMPPPVAGSGSVGVGSIIVPTSSGTGIPIRVTTLRGLTDYDDSVAPTGSQAPVWNVAASKFKPTTVVTKVSGATPDASGSVSLDARYIVDTDTSRAKIVDNAEPVIYKDETTNTWPLRSTVTPSATRHVTWVGPDAPPIGSGFAQDNVDFWRQTPPLTS
jgi:hypothetical protein